MSKIIHCNQLPSVPLGYLAIIDGKTNKTSKDFLNTIWEQLNFTKMEKHNWDAYLDWMRDLSWIDINLISIVVLDFESFLSEDPEKKYYFLYDLEKTIFPFWKNDAPLIFENDKTKLKNINVYCIS